ncbi:hypothetical protein H310_02236 [Aphanomyces invadans]|uniref:PH domain-containing protein n=1 Tax=Aphanomyces invadans TaxID=157072 RepID=A0A024UPN6_9STRA|nr:hypothetical protein H310_02236 [Aphanomyces invadans]ETW07807.1 hypothetical protein H310_02236 [Aphanomyces invadans]|eukprot:XP_008863900.1 hypothetical protein H310_02236 [Aphanomyces invadans]
MVTSMQLIMVDADEHLTVNPDAVRFLNESYDALTVFSFHGAKDSGKSALLRELLQSSEPTTGDHADSPAPHADILTPPSDFSGVWMYFEETTYAHAKSVIYLDVQSHGENEGLDALLFGIASSLSSNVINCSTGHIDDHVFESLSFLQTAVDVLGENPELLPGLTWVVRDLSTKDVKAVVGMADASADMDQLYLQAVLSPKTSPFTSNLSWQILTSFFPKRTGSILPLSSSPAYPKKVHRLRKALLESSHVKAVHGVALHRSLFSHILDLLCGERTSITSKVAGPTWDAVLQSDMLNLVEKAFAVYKTTVDSHVSHGQSQQQHDDLIEFPCDETVLKDVHEAGKAAAQPLLVKVAVLGGDYATVATRLFRDLTAHHVAKWMDENDRASTAQCIQVLQALHTDIERLIKAKLQPQDEPLRLADFKAILRAYQHSVQNMVVEYASEAQGPQKMPVLSTFYSTLMPRFVEYLAHLGELTMKSQTALAEQAAATAATALADAVRAKTDAMESIKASQRQVQAKMVANIHLETRIKSVLEDAIEDVMDLYDKAKIQGSALEAQAFNNVERTAERVLEVSQANKDEEGVLEGYLVKQGGGGVFGRKNWKQRYFLLHKNILSYAKTKDDYERGKILKEFSIVGSVIKDSEDAGEGFEVWPPSTGQAVYDYKQGLFGSDPTLGRRKVDSDSERIFYLRASTMEVKDQWVERLRRAVNQASHTH